MYVDRRWRRRQLACQPAPLISLTGAAFPDWTRQRHAGSFGKWLGNWQEPAADHPPERSPTATPATDPSTEPQTAERLTESSRWIAAEQIRHGVREYRINTAGELEVAEVHRPRNWRGKAVDRFARFLLPDGYPDAVGPDYAEYTWWRGRAFFFGGMVGVFSTQSLLLAVGVGRPSAAPVAAALQWVIRDGLGRAGRMLFSQVGTGFDAETKQHRLAAAFVLNAACALETLTPLVPSFFLPLASVANMAKGASTVAAASTRGAIYRSFMRRENLGDITAKQETVGVAGDLLGTAVGIVLSRLSAHSTRWSMAAFAGASLGHLYSAYREVKSVQLRTLNRQRAHALVWTYLEQQRRVPSVPEVNRSERVILRPWLDWLHAPNMQLGARLADAAPDAEALQYVLQLYKNERYLLTYEGGRVRVVLRHDATSHDQLKAFFQSREFWRRYTAGGERHARNRELLEQSYRTTQNEFANFMRECRALGWNTDTVLLRPAPRRVTWK